MKKHQVFHEIRQYFFGRRFIFQLAYGVIEQRTITLFNFFSGQKTSDTRLHPDYTSLFSSRFLKSKTNEKQSTIMLYRFGVDNISSTLKYILLSSPSRIELSGSDCWRVRVRWLPHSFARVSYGILPQNNTLLFIIITVDIKRYRSWHGCRGPLSHTNGRANGSSSERNRQSRQTGYSKNKNRE